jgi:hypothetical protein
VNSPVKLIHGVQAFNKHPFVEGSNRPPLAIWNQSVAELP